VEAIYFFLTDLCIGVKVERRLRVFKGRMLRRMFGPMREEVAGGCRRLHNEELRNF